jgi:Domain of unknown function (DUF4129)
MMRCILSNALLPPFFLFIVCFLVSERMTLGAPLSLEEYRSRIGRSMEVLRSQEMPLREGDHLKALEKEFPQDLELRDRRGAPILIDARTISRWIEEARGSSEGQARLLRHLESLHEQISLPAGGHRLAETEWEKSRLALDQVYDDREFQHLHAAKPPAVWDYIMKIIDRIKAWLGEHIGSVEGIPFTWVSYVFYGLLIVAGGWALIWIIRSSGALGWRWKQPAVRKLSDGRESVSGSDWGSWRSKAYRKAGEGAFREAIRAFFVSVLKEGAGRGWWVYQAVATNREHLAAVKGPEERRTALSDLIDLYEKTWYGLRESDQEAFSSCIEWLHRMEAAREA